ncbi:hypothetical protein VBZ51_14155 [Maribacter sp. HS]|uniref:hypothetical protein n=1 Tax=Maribacter sp. HS TaxID=3110480 RepID=UPI003A876E9F
MTSIEHFIYLKKRLNDWKNSKDERLKKFHIDMVNKHLEENLEIISQLALDESPNYANEILDEIKYHENHFENSMNELFISMRKQAIVNCISSELTNFKDASNELNAIKQIIEKYELDYFDNEILSKSIDKKIFIEKCNFIIEKIGGQ